ncbi:MAG: hypothetical protein H0Z28_13790 [Archaeoglobus sp.]|nr:hypothetical protein [Archaeoglobus sp.]
MKKNKEVIDMEPKIKVSLKMVPFGTIQYEIKGLEHPMEEEEIERPRYIEPLTTHIEKVEIRYEEGETYSVPKTTVGI